MSGNGDPSASASVRSGIAASTRHHRSWSAELFSVPCRNKVKILIGDFRIARTNPVDHDFELGRDGIEINRRGKDNHIGGNEFREQVAHIVFLHALVRGVADAASGAEIDFQTLEADFFNLISLFRVVFSFRFIIGGQKIQLLQIGLRPKESLEIFEVHHMIAVYLIFRPWWNSGGGWRPGRGE